ncbi:MAG: aldo/keto reductase [Nitrososphaerales archaeon]
MQYLKLGSSGLSVPRICLGTNNFGGGQIDQETCNKIMGRALDLGMNMFDTADCYTKGNSEKIIGQFIKDRREEVIVTTKVGKEFITGEANPNRLSVSRKNIIYQLGQSLSRLQTDYVDLYYIHQYDAGVPLVETMKTLDSLVKAGKIRYIACSNYSAEQIKESQEIAQKFGLENYIAVQNEYSLFERGIEAEVIPYCLQHGVGVLAYSTLSGGVLAGRYESGKSPPQGSRATYRQPSWWSTMNSVDNFRKLENVKGAADKAGLRLPVLAIAWVLREQRVATAVTGASKPEQLEEACKALDVKLDLQTIDELNKSM